MSNETNHVKSDERIKDFSQHEAYELGAFEDDALSAEDAQASIVTDRELEAEDGR